MTPRALFRTFATAEAFTWAGLIAAIVLRTTDVTAAAVPIAGGLHGFVFLAYCVTTVLVWADQRWRVGTGVLGLVLAAVPFATVPFELVVDRKGLLGRTWRLRREGDEPCGFVERVMAWAIRNPYIALLVMFAAVSAVFVTLLWLGPPVARD